MPQTLAIYRVGDEAPVALAAKELARCLRKMAPVRCRVLRAAAYDEAKPGVYVGTGDSLRSAIGPRACKSHCYDDETLIRSLGKSVLVSGSNPRSVLFAAYRLLEGLGARWPFPGKVGEYLPALKRLTFSNLDIHEKPAFRHRAISDEGPVSLEHVLDYVDWMPKVRLNALYMELKNFSQQWRGWYEHGYNPDFKPAQYFPPTEYPALVDKVVAALRERGLLHHRVGHGWTAECLGVEAAGWIEVKQPVPEDKRQLVAMVNGKREWWTGIALNTELCYSNPEARRLLVDHVVEYALQHPEVDFLHFWLSDSTNNHCECAECVKTDPADVYVRLVKEISRRLKEAGTRTRIVFLCYANTLWPPLVETLGPEYDNVVFMYAPISRCFAHALADPRCTSGEQLHRPPRNKLRPPHSNRELLAFRKMWGEKVQGDNFIYDYYLWLHPEGPHGGLPLAKVVWQDARDRKSLDLNGLIAVHNLRNFYPTGLVQWAIGESDWDPRKKFEDIVGEYFAAAFGPVARAARAYLEGFAEATGKPPHAKRWWQDLNRAKAERVVEYLRTQGRRLQTMSAKVKAAPHRKAMALLKHHYRLHLMLWEGILAHENGDDARAKRSLDRAEAFLRRTEGSLHQLVNFERVLLFVSAIRRDVLKPS